MIFASIFSKSLSFSGVSTQYQVQVPGLGLLTVFSQNLAFGPIVNLGAEVWLTWTIDHGFGLEDDPATMPRFEPDEDTSQIATQRRERLEAELEEA